MLSGNVIMPVNRRGVMAPVNALRDSLRSNSRGPLTSPVHSLSVDGRVCLLLPLREQGARGILSLIVSMSVMLLAVCALVGAGFCFFFGGAWRGRGGSGHSRCQLDARQKGPGRSSSRRDVGWPLAMAVR
jgi:hypothetical protein